MWDDIIRDWGLLHRDESWTWHDGRPCPFGGTGSNGFLSHSGTVIHNSIIYPYIVLSDTFKVPTLCFKAENTNGELISIDQLKNTLQDIWNQSILGSLQGFNRLINTGEHPCIRYETVFIVNACDTHKMMDQYFDEHELSIKYLDCWWSLYGCLVGLSMKSS